MSGAMKSGVLRRSSSIVSRARGGGGAVLFKSEHVSRNRSYWRTVFRDVLLQKLLPAIRK